MLEEFNGLTVQQIVEDAAALFGLDQAAAVALVDNAILSSQLETLLYELGY